MRWSNGDLPQVRVFIDQVIKYWGGEPSHVLHKLKLQQLFNDPMFKCKYKLAAFNARRLKTCLICFRCVFAGS